MKTTSTQEETSKEKSIPIQNAIRTAEAKDSIPTTSSSDQNEILSEIPDVMRPTARYFLFRTGRKKLTQNDIQSLKATAENHTPARIQKEIDVAVERFIRKGRKLKQMNFAYITASLEKQKSYEKGVTGKKTLDNNKKPTKRNLNQEDKPHTLKVKEKVLPLEEAERVISEYAPPVKESTFPPALQELHEKMCAAEMELDELYLDSKYPKDEDGNHIIPDGDYSEDDYQSLSLEAYLHLKFPNASEKELQLDRAYDPREIQKAFEFDMKCVHCGGRDECPFNHKYGRPVVTLENGKLNHRYTLTIPCRYDVVKPDPELQRRIKRSGLTEFQLKQTFATYKNNSAETTVVKAKAMLAAKNKTSLVLAGKPGTGKTHLAIAIAMDAIQHGRQALITTMPDMLNELKDADWSHTDFFGVMRKFREVDCLVLDDWDKEKINEKGMEYLYQIINSRYTHGRHTIVTTNFLNPVMIWVTLKRLNLCCPDCLRTANGYQSKRPRITG